MSTSRYLVRALALLMLFVTEVYNSESDFGYSGRKGPDHWANELDYHTCEGKLQSPINIDEHFVVPIRFPPLEFKGFDVRPNSCVLTNNGHTVMLELKTGQPAMVSGGPLNGDYMFSQLHFHWGANDSVGSEDQINNHSFPMELHMVFYKLEYGDVPSAMQFKDGLTVFAVFYEVSDFENRVYSEIVRHLDKVTQPHTKAQLLTRLTLDNLLPSNKYHYYTYNGSLTTPPCSEVVTWLDFKEPIYLSHSQVAAFRRLKSPDGVLTHNFRPVQPLGGRTVYYNVGERPFHLGRRHIPNSGTSSALAEAPYHVLLAVLAKFIFFSS